jgi:hypothetical protein
LRDAQNQDRGQRRSAGAEYQALHDYLLACVNPSIEWYV